LPSFSTSRRHSSNRPCCAAWWRDNISRPLIREILCRKSIIFRSCWRAWSFWNWKRGSSNGFIQQIPLKLFIVISKQQNPTTPHKQIMQRQRLETTHLTSIFVLKFSPLKLLQPNFARHQLASKICCDGDPMPSILGFTGLQTNTCCDISLLCVHLIVPFFG
jgi:hypothetical protein